jgi:hypothetical protein
MQEVVGKVAFQDTVEMTCAVYGSCANITIPIHVEFLSKCLYGTSWSL